MWFESKIVQGERISFTPLKNFPKHIFITLNNRRLNIFIHHPANAGSLYDTYQVCLSSILSSSAHENYGEQIYPSTKYIFFLDCGKISTQAFILYGLYKFKIFFLGTLNRVKYILRRCFKTYKVKHERKI